MCIASTPKAPTPAAPAPTQQNYTNASDVIDSSNANRQRAAAAQGFQSTIKTSASGLDGVPTGKKTLLGQ